MNTQIKRQHTLEEGQRAYDEFVDMGFRPLRVIEDALSGGPFDADELLARYEAVNVAAMQSGNAQWRKKAALMEVMLIAVL